MLIIDLVVSISIEQYTGFIGNPALSVTHLMQLDRHGALDQTIVTNRSLIAGNDDPLNRAVSILMRGKKFNHVMHLIVLSLLLSQKHAIP